MGAAFLALNPFLIVNKLTASTMKPMDHEMHHADPRVNFALFFTWWVVVCGWAVTSGQSCMGGHTQTVTPQGWLRWSVGLDRCRAGRW